MTSTFAGASYFYDSDKVFKYRDEKMCDKWKKDDKSYSFFSIQTHQNNQGEVVMYGKVNNRIMDYLKKHRVYLRYWAANPPTTGSSFSGSGLPYPNRDVAYENTQNQGGGPHRPTRPRIALRIPFFEYKNLSKTFYNCHKYMRNYLKCLGTPSEAPVRILLFRQLLRLCRWKNLLFEKMNLRDSRGFQWVPKYQQGFI